MINKVQKAELETQSWYRMLRGGIPKAGTTEFAHFAGQSSAFLGTINPAEKNSYKFIVDNNSDSAYIDKTNCVIAIPGWYLDPKAITELNEDVTDASIAATILVNGSMIHEPLHSRYTPNTLDELIKSLGTDRANALKEDYGEFVNTVTNLIEDLFIEGDPMNEHPHYRFFVDGKNAILFSRNKFEEAIEKFETAPTFTNALALSFFYKFVGHRTNGVFGKFPVSAVYALRQATTLSESTAPAARAELVEMFCRSFVIPTASEKATAGSGGKEKSGAGSKTKIDGIPDPSTEGMSSKSKGATTEAKREFSESAEEAAKESTEKLYSEGYDSYVSKPKRYDVMTYPGKLTLTHTRTIENTENYNFIKNIMRLKTKNHVYGEALNRGNHLVNTRISRIATDGKIFSRQNAQQQVEKPVEIIMLVDASGSMGSRYLKVLTAAKGIHEACRKMNMSNAVYAHTSHVDRTIGFEIPSLIHISSYNMRQTNGDVDQRFDEALRIRLYENFDGHMIEEVVKQFTQRDARKVLIVLSDGEPSGPGYRYGFAIDHTKAAILKARKAGIVVLCMSLVEEVISANNDIYGRKSNIDATSNVKAEFERVITNVNEE